MFWNKFNCCFVGIFPIILSLPTQCNIIDGGPMCGWAEATKIYFICLTP